MSFITQTELDYKLLIIDDEVEITRTIARQFRKKYKVYTATSAQEALTIMEKEHIQVILSDQRMPGISGVDFFGLIKDKYPDALKLILTGYSDIEAVIGAINEGQVFRYITKPWNPDELESILNEAFEKYELITNNRKLMFRLQEANELLEQKVKLRTSELENSNLRLSELNREKNRYIGMVAHDLRNPISIAEAFSGLLIERSGTFDRADQLEYIRIINKECAFSLSLIQEFLNTSKIEAGIFDLKLQTLDFPEFVRSNARRNGILLQQKSQHIEVRAVKAELKATFDPEKMEQVLNNLISNAGKYSLPGTTITIEIGKSENDVLTHVIDQGQGIPEDELSTIFRSYTTGSVRATHNEKSTGLGLAIVRKIIEAHQGNISVESEVGKGSVFSFRFPVGD